MGKHLKFIVKTVEPFITLQQKGKVSPPGLQEDIKVDQGFVLRTESDYYSPEPRCRIGIYIIQTNIMTKNTNTVM